MFAKSSQVSARHAYVVEVRSGGIRKHIPAMQLVHLLPEIKHVRRPQPPQVDNSVGRTTVDADRKYNGIDYGTRQIYFSFSAMSIVRYNRDKAAFISLPFALT